MDYSTTQTALRNDLTRAESLRFRRGDSTIRGSHAIDLYSILQRASGNGSYETTLLRSQPYNKAEIIYANAGGGIGYDDGERISISTLGIQIDAANTVRKYISHNQLDTKAIADRNLETNTISLAGVNLEAEIASLASPYDRRPAETNNITSMQARSTSTQGGN